MTIHVCWLLAMLLADPVAADVERLDVAKPDFLISRNEVLADVNEVCAVLVTHESAPTASAVDYQQLHAQVVEKLKASGLEHVECQTGLTPRLYVHAEVVALDDCGASVYRVQTALSRIVTFTDHRELKVQADVWRLRPVMKAAPDARLNDELTAAVLTQVEVFAGACKAAQRLRTSSASPETPPEEVTADSQVVQASFIASKNSAVFHRADCPSAQKIAERNVVTYANRQEAIDAGKRPCKSCRP